MQHSVAAAQPQNGWRSHLEDEWRRSLCGCLTVPAHAAHGSRAIGWKTVAMAASSSGVRPASGQDAGACPAIYRPYVQNTAISWAIDVRPLTQLDLLDTGGPDGPPGPIR